MRKQSAVFPFQLLVQRYSILITHASASHLLIYNLIWLVGVSVPRLHPKCSLLQTLRGQLCFPGCFWVGPQAPVAQPRPFVLGVSIQQNTYTEQYICSSTRDKYTSWSMYLD